MKIVPLKQEHLDRIEIQGAHAYVSGWLTEAIKKEMEKGMSFAAIDGDNVLGCAGIIDYWPGRSAAWAILSGTCGRNFVAIHRAVQSFLSLKTYGRLEATADVDFGAAHRWLEMLGFKLETEKMPGYLPNGGGAAAMYVMGV